MEHKAVVVVPAGQVYEVVDGLRSGQRVQADGHAAHGCDHLRRVGLRRVDDHGRGRREGGTALAGAVGVRDLVRHWDLLGDPDRVGGAQAPGGRRRQATGRVARVTQRRASLRYGAAHGTLAVVSVPGARHGRAVSRPSATQRPSAPVLGPGSPRRAGPLGWPGVLRLRGGLAGRPRRAVLVLRVTGKSACRHHRGPRLTVSSNLQGKHPDGLASASVRSLPYGLEAEPLMKVQRPLVARHRVDFST